MALPQTLNMIAVNKLPLLDISISWLLDLQGLKLRLNTFPERPNISLNGLMTLLLKAPLNIEPRSLLFAYL